MNIEKDFSTADSNMEQCDHWYGLRYIKHTSAMGKTWEEPIWIVPYVIITYSEGGYNATATCLECIVKEAVYLGLCISHEDAKEAQN